jgi:hypothetical protein
LFKVVDAGPPSPIPLSVNQTDPAGTYLLSLSTSNTVDSRETTAHFGIFGTDARNYERTEKIAIAGGGFAPNSTITLALSLEDKTYPGFPLDIKAGIGGDFTYSLGIPSSASEGNLTIAAAGLTFDNNQISVATSVQILSAQIGFSVSSSNRVERTTAINVNATITYPNSTILTPEVLTSGANLTITAGNFTRTLSMNFNEATLSWSAMYFVPLNATLGDYVLFLAAKDDYGNTGNFTSHSSVIPAKLGFIIPATSSKAQPRRLIDISVYVTYPDGSSLAGLLGEVNASYTTSSGNNTVPMVFNQTDGKWHFSFLTPDLGFSFGTSTVFTFEAKDKFRNSGVATNAYEVVVGARFQDLVLALIAGAVVPLALLVWAIFAISGRRRKHRP